MDDFVRVKVIAHLLVVPPLYLVHVKQVVHVVQQKLRLKVNQHDVPINHCRLHLTLFGDLGCQVQGALHDSPKRLAHFMGNVRCLDWLSFTLAFHNVVLVFKMAIVHFLADWFQNNFNCGLLREKGLFALHSVKLDFSTQFNAESHFFYRLRRHLAILFSFKFLFSPFDDLFEADWSWQGIWCQLRWNEDWGVRVLDWAFNWFGSRFCHPL